MSHFTEQELIDAYYNRAHPPHLDDCPECRAAFEQLQHLLDAMNDLPVPERDAAYGARVWSRLQPQLPAPKPRRQWFQWWTLAPALAMLLVIAFVGGMLTQQRRTADTYAKARERVLLIALSRHLERSQIVLAQVVNAAPVAGIDLSEESALARDLVDENRLLRQSAAHDGDTRDALLLDELERALLDIANAPPNVSAADLASLQNRIDSEGLLFKVRVTSSDTRFKGQKL